MKIKNIFNYIKKYPERNLGIVILIVLAIAIVYPQGIVKLAGGHDCYALDISQRLLPPSAEHWFGTNEGGRDIFTRVIYGTRYTLGISLAIVAIAVTFGTVYGVVAGYFGGRLENIMMRIVDLFLSFPYLILAMAIASTLGRDEKSSVISLSLVWWPMFARMVRGQVISIKQNLYVEAARAIGLSEPVILFRHILPHCFNEVRERVLIDIGKAIISLTGLSFLGLGVQNPSPEWGLMVSNSRNYVLTAWWYSVLPGIVILISVMGFTLAGEKKID